MLNNFLSSLKYKHYLFALLIGLIIVFGMFSVIYEELTFSSDNISSVLKTSQVGLYLHFPRSSKAEPSWTLLPSEVKNSLTTLVPDFFREQNVIEGLNPTEYAYVTFTDNQTVEPAWLIVWSQPILPLLPDNLTAATSGNLLVISQQAEQIKTKYLTNNSLGETLADKIWSGLSRPANAPYLYVDFSRWPATWPSVGLLGEWRLVLNDSFFEIVELSTNNFKDSDESDKVWLDTFSSENVLFYNLSAIELKWLWQHNTQAQASYLNLVEWQAMTGIDLFTALSNLSTSFNFVLNPSGDEEKLPTWLLSLPNEQKSYDLIISNLTSGLGYLKPKIKVTTLPDQSVINELVAADEKLNFQQYNLSGQIVNIVYFTEENYVFYLPYNNQLLVGNSLKLLNRLITESKGGSSLGECFKNPDKLYSFKTNPGQQFSIGYWNNKKQPVYRLCY